MQEMTLDRRLRRHPYGGKVAMRYVLSRASRETLEQLTAARVLMAFDFDGTLAPIVRDPERARLRARTGQLLRRVANVYPCVVISGRSRTDLRSKLAGTGILHTIGNHGAEPWEGGAAIRRQVEQWSRLLARELLPRPGLLIENKHLSITVHYRQCRFKAKAHARILQAAALLQGARLIPGKEAVSFVPVTAPNKGMALRVELERLRCDCAIYIGDDQTDEDVFSLDEGSRLLSIRVGRSIKSRAAYFIRSQNEIDDFLQVLLSL
jgi:trehalose 6-phosphate phosphatase